MRPVCPGNTSHLSRDMSCLSRGHSVPLHINQAQLSHVSLGRPEFVPGTLRGIPTAKFLYVIFLYRFFLSINDQSEYVNVIGVISEPFAREFT